MPRLPTSEDMGRRPTPSAKGGISPLNLTTPQRGQEAQALVQFGNSLKGVGDVIARLAEKEKVELDGARAEDHVNQLHDGYLVLEFGNETTEGFTQVLAGDAVKRNLAEEYREKREQLKKSLREGLANDDQRRLFDARANIADRQAHSRVYSHMAEQSRAYQGVVSEGVRATERRMAALNWDQPGQIELSILRTHKEVERKAGLDGYDPEREDDRKVIDTLKVIAETQIHSDVIDHMILTGKDSAAAAYYQAVERRLTPEARITVGMKVDISATGGRAIRAADEAWAIAGPQGPNDAVRLDILSNLVRDKYSSEPKIMEAALQDLRSRASDHNHGQAEFSASNQAKILDNWRKGTPLKELQASNEWLDISGDERERLFKYMTDSGYTEQARKRGEHEYIEGLKSKHGFRRFWELSNPSVLSRMSENQIWALEPELGHKNTADLIKLRAEMNSPAKVQEATLDASLFNTAAVDAGLDPYARNLSPEKKEQLGRLKNEALAVIAEAQDIAKRKLNRDEKEKILHGVLDKKVQQAGMFGSKTSMPAAVVRPADADKISVPMADIDPAWTKEAINYMRSVGAVPSDPSWNDAKVITAYRGRLERAYALKLIGEDGRAVLEGR